MQGQTHHRMRTNIYCAAGVTSAANLHPPDRKALPEAKVAQAVARGYLVRSSSAATPWHAIGFGGQKLHRNVAILQIQQWLEEAFLPKVSLEEVASQAWHEHS